MLKKSWSVLWDGTASGLADQWLSGQEYGLVSENSAKLWPESIFWDICRRLIEQGLRRGHFLAKRPDFGRFDILLV